MLRLDGPARFRHFVKRVADAECAWGLWSDGWALLANDAGTPVFPLWPAPEYAERCCTGDWAEFEATSIPLEELLDELLPSLAKHGTVPGIFPTPGGQSVLPGIEALTAALREELTRYQ